MEAKQNINRDGARENAQKERERERRRRRRGEGEGREGQTEEAEKEGRGEGREGQAEEAEKEGRGGEREERGRQTDTHTHTHTHTHTQTDRLVGSRVGRVSHDGVLFQLQIARVELIPLRQQLLVWEHTAPHRAHRISPA